MLLVIRVHSDCSSQQEVFFLLPGKPEASSGRGSVGVPFPRERKGSIPTPNSEVW